jgi:glycosyltransferase involved in cell wall biosynthesis
LLRLRSAFIGWVKGHCALGALAVVMPVVLVVGDAAAPTGFSRVTSSIMARLNDRYAVHQLGINYVSGPHGESWPIYPAGDGLRDRHGLKRIAGIVNMVRPAVVLIVNDVGVVAQYLTAMASVDCRPKVVAYMPVDSGPLMPDHVRGIASLDRIVVYNQFAADTLTAASNEVTAEDPSFVLPPMSIIPHGVDTSVFRPLFPLTGKLAEARKAARHQLMPGSDALNDAFIVLNANRNQPRKRIDITIAGFAKFAADKPDNVMLYLHMGMTDIGWDIRELARRHGIMDRLIITHEGDNVPGSSPEQLNRIYNTCDIGINTSEAESWGLTAFEHAATGAAQIVPGHTGTGEIWDGVAEMLTPALSLTSPGSLIASELIDPHTVATTLERLYRNPDLLQARSLSAYGHATQRRYHWDTVAQSFDEILSDLVDQPEGLRDPPISGHQTHGLAAAHGSARH